nr:hypothetical protein L203_05811 [Cryptococcus depauperatus CBS 7841]
MSDPAIQTRKDKIKAKGAFWGKIEVDKGVKFSDNIGETFSPVTSDSLNRMDKCARILRAFIVDGVVTEGKMEGSDGRKKKKKVIRKIPPAVIDRAKGYRAFGGARDASLVVTKLSDGSWSAPTSISPNILSAVPLLGADVYDCALVIRDQKALESFETRKITIGAELGVAARQYGGGAAVEAGLDKAPVWLYETSWKRFEENDAMYHWPRAEASDILSGKTLKDAESGKAQSEKGDTLDIIVPEGATEFERHNEEVLKLPSTPDMINGREQGSDLETKVPPLLLLPQHPSHKGSPHPSLSLHTVHLPVPRRAVPLLLPSRRPPRSSLKMIYRLPHAARIC